MKILGFAVHYESVFTGYFMKSRHSKILLLILGLFLGGVAMWVYTASAPLSEESGEKAEAPKVAEKMEFQPNEKDPAINFGFRPHKALYDVSLSSKKSGAQIVNIAGQMLYEWSSGCDAWNSNHRFNLLYEYADTSPMRITSDFSTYESFDGKEMHFTSQRKRDGELFEELRGFASLGDRDGKADYSIPETLEFDLTANTLFPMQHTMDVVQKIHDGKKFYKATIFDGSDEDGPLDINAFIGKETKVEKEFRENKNIDQELLGTKAWNVRLAFFPLTNPETTSDYEMSLVLHENGVISDMDVEYSDFSVSQKLIALEPINENGCAQTKTEKEE